MRINRIAWIQRSRARKAGYRRAQPLEKSRSEAHRNDDSRRQALFEIHRLPMAPQRDAPRSAHRATRRQLETSNRSHAACAVPAALDTTSLRSSPERRNAYFDGAMVSPQNSFVQLSTSHCATRLTVLNKFEAVTAPKILPSECEARPGVPAPGSEVLEVIRSVHSQFRI